MIPRKLLILDLDETLMFATAHPPDNLWTHELANFKVYVRPHLAFFLDEIKKEFDVAVWSSAGDMYVQLAVEILFPPGYPLVFVWGRSRCTWQPDLEKIEREGFYDQSRHYQYVKRLRKLKGRIAQRKEHILVIDDTPEKSKYNYGNAIYPGEFKGDPADNELLLLAAYLHTLRDVSNVRVIEKRNWRNETKRTC